MSEGEKRGLFIVVEGGDRSGKSTLARSLAAALGPNTFLGSFPDRSTPIGQLINAHLKGGNHLSPHAIHLLFSANRHEAADVLLQKIRGGTNVVLDRYVPSGIAYSVAKGLDLEWCKAADQGLPRPDLILFVDLPAEVAAARAGYGEELFEKAEFQQKVMHAFAHLRKQKAFGHWISIDGTQTQEQMFQAALSAVQVTASSNLSFYYQ